MTSGNGRARSFVAGAVVLMLAAGVSAPASAAPSRPVAEQAAALPSGTPRGSWHIDRLDTGRWQVSWTSPTRLPITSDRPQLVTGAGAPAGVTTLAGDGRTVRTVVVSGSRPTPARLGVVLSGERLDRSRTTAARPDRRRGSADLRRTTRTPAASGPVLDVDPGVRGPYAVTTSDYVRPSVRIAGMPQPIEMVGHVVEPVASAATGPRPLVLFLHGRHEYCYVGAKGTPNDAWPCRGVMREVPSQLGYDYLQRLLASQGFATVSIRANGINAQDYLLADGGASARATLVQRHLDYWTTIAAQHQVDLRRVVLVGHSRGGEGVDRASIRIPVGAPYTIVGQVLIAPTDFGVETAPGIPTVTLLPYCDGDVSDLEGQRYTDVARDVTSGDTALKSSVLIMGANHNFFNTQWTPGLSTAPSADDWSGEPRQLCGDQTPARLTPARQRAVGQAYVAGAAALFTGYATGATAAPSLLRMFDGSRVRVASAGSAVTYSHSLGGDRDLRRPGRDTTLTLADGAESSFCIGATSWDYRPGLCGSESDAVTPHWPQREEHPIRSRTFWQLSWTARGQSGGLRLNRPLDLRSRHLDLRTIVDYVTGPTAIRVRLGDTSGRSAVVAPDGGGALVPLPASPPSAYEQAAKQWAQDVRVDPAGVAGEVDLSRIATVELVAASPRGRLWLADLSASAGAVVPVSGTRPPTLSIGTATVTEGNAAGTTVARVPFRLSRPMDRPGSFSVFTDSEQSDSARLFTVDLAPGQRSGTIPVGYRADRVDSSGRMVTSVVAGATTNVMTDQYVGSLTVLDDDPAPKITFSRVHRKVREGASAQWRVTLNRPAGYEIAVLGRVVRGPGRDLTGADVPARWLAEHAMRTSPKKTLAALGVSVFAVVAAGSRSAVVAIPTRRDGRREPVEAVTLRLRSFVAEQLAKQTASATLTVRVAASR